ncbi:hypothetical protein [Bosea sp. LjRoot237]|uniref:hypothetical protein n=1 Tax=Bosea sp. LjRoot237 TaxID=3342292 RepID=UPI003ECF9715
MKLTGQLGVLLVALFLCSVFVLMLCLTFWLDAACTNEQRRVIMKATGGVGCFEFWFNRYQSLIGNLLTAGVAGAALIWAARQFGMSYRQNAVSAAQVLRSRAGEISAERDLVDGAIKIVSAISDFPNTYGGVPAALTADRGTINAYARRLSTAFNELNAVDQRDRDGQLAETRRKLLLAMNSASLQLKNAFEVSDALQRASEPLQQEYREILNSTWAEIRLVSHDCTVASNFLFNGLFHEAEATWRQVRKFERIAIGET